MEQIAITQYESESFTHRLLWTSAQHHLKAGTDVPYEGSQWNLMAALLLSYLAYEAYLNFLGDRLAPDVWAGEKSFFRKPPYQGTDGKLQYILEKLSPLKVEKGTRPYRTIAKLEEFRHLLVHGKPEKDEGSIEHPITVDPQVLQSEVWSYITLVFAQRAAEDVESFTKNLHEHAKPKLPEDIWFGESPFEGSLGYASRTKKLKT